MTAAMRLRRKLDPRPAGVVAPPESRRAPVWDRPVPGVGRAPLVWLLGVHGGGGGGRPGGGGRARPPPPPRPGGGGVGGSIYPPHC